MSDNPNPAGGQPAPTPDPAAGSHAAVLADLAAERKSRQAAEGKLAELEKEKADREAAALSDHEKALAKARDEATAAATKDVKAKMNSRILKTEVKRLAAEKFADPADPVGAIDLAQFSVDDDGNVDEKAIQKELDQLLVAKPHWAKSGVKSGPGSADQGGRGTGTSGFDMDAQIRRDAGRG